MAWYSRSDEARDYAEESGISYEQAYDEMYGHEFPQEPDEADIIMGIVENED